MTSSHHLASWKAIFKTIRKEGNVLFNDTLNTFYLRLYGVRHMVKDHSDSEREKTRCHHMGYSFWLAARVLLYASSHRQDVTPVVDHWLEWKIAQWVHPMKDRSDDPSHHERTLLPRSYISFPQNNQFPLLLFIQLSAYLFTHINALFYPKKINELFIKIKLQNFNILFWLWLTYQYINCIYYNCINYNI